MDKEAKTNYSIPIVIVLAGIIIAGAMYFSNSKKALTPVIENTSSQSTEAKISQVKIEGAPFIGNPGAPVVIAEWFDYQCPACKYADQRLITPLVDDYVKKGKVKIVFKDFSFLGKDSQTIAITARAVWEAYPDKYYEWHKVMFNNQGQENTGWATKEVIINLMEKVAGIDVNLIDELIAKNSDKYQALVDADREEGIKLGVKATPTFVYADVIESGVPQYSNFKSTVDVLLTAFTNN
jgi:protein-disulfide isomerase